MPLFFQRSDKSKMRNEYYREEMEHLNGKKAAPDQSVAALAKLFFQTAKCFFSSCNCFFDVFI